MSKSSKNFDLSKLIPGFDTFAQMAKQMPGMGQGFKPSAMQNPFIPKAGSWVMPTLSTEELEKRITELQTVKLWLENNARLIEATVQALQVQKMTLSTLEGMKENLGKAWPFAAADGTAASKKATARNKTHFDMGADIAQAQAEPEVKKPAKKRPSAAEKAEQAAAEQAILMQQAGQQAVAMWQGMAEQFGQITSQVMQNSQAAAEKLAKTASAKPAAKKSVAKKTATKKAPARTAAPSAAKPAAKPTAKKTTASKKTATKRSR